MKLRFPAAAAVALSLSLAASSCSVKMDRGDCPCWLDVVVTGAYGKTLSLSLWNPSLLMREELDMDRCERTYEYRVPRGRMSLTACVGIGQCRLDGGNVVIPPGCDMAPLFAYGSELDASGESVSDTVKVHKEYAAVQLDVSPRPDGMPVSVVVTGEVAGVCLADSSPVPGPFRHVPVSDDGMSFGFRLPRQDGPDGLLLYVDEEVLPLGRMLCDAGYDWGAEDLDDVRVVVDRVGGTACIGISGWEQQYYNLEI